MSNINYYRRTNMTKYKMIAIDTEYHCNEIGLIDNVYCISCIDKQGQTFSKWVSHTKDPNILETIIESYRMHEVDDSDVKYVFICHALEKAERRALLHLNVDVEKYNFICTWQLAKMLQNTFKAGVVKESLSYASLCAKYNLSLIDTDYKQQMRRLCVEDRTQGYENEIMKYCTEDTEFLIPLFNKLFPIYHNRLNNSFCPIDPKTFQNISKIVSIECLINLNKSILEFGKVADKGIRLNPERVLKIKQNAPRYRSELKRQFNEQYPGCYRLENTKTGQTYVCDTKVVQQYLKQCIIESNLKNYPKTKTGYCTDSDTLKEYFKDTDTFGEHLRQHKKQITLLNKVSKAIDNPLDSIIDDRLWYESLEPMGTITGRCTPKGKFIFGWHKSFYGLMEPPKGKWYVELDYSAEETFIQACICKDKVYHHLYASKDIYLGFVKMLGQIPDDDWKNLSTDELKDKYGTIRKQYKTVLLGLSYGMGTQKLAEKGKMSFTRAEKTVNDVKRILKASTQYKERLEFAASKAKAFSNPDGFICEYNPVTAKHTSFTNWPFQSGGGYILRVLLHRLLTECKSANMLGCIHDAVFFEVDEGDYDTINKVRQIMQDVVGEVLNEKEHTIKVGKEDIIKHGDIWCADDENKPINKNKFIDLLEYSVDK